LDRPLVVIRRLDGIDRDVQVLPRRVFGIDEGRAQ
jgi:hypothetical protein